MLVVFDHGTPRGLARALSDHSIATAKAMGWERLSNGRLLQAAESGNFDLLLATDRRIRYQQNLSGRTIAIVVLTGTTKWSEIRPHLERIRDAVGAATASSYSEVFIPFKQRPPTFRKNVI